VGNYVKKKKKKTIVELFTSIFISDNIICTLHNRLSMTNMERLHMYFGFIDEVCL